MLVFGSRPSGKGVTERRSRFSVEQIVAVLKQVGLGLAVADAIRQPGISEQTFYRWKKLYGSLQPDQAREFK